jgi:hypothetical protein
MSPVWIIEGAARRDPEPERELAARRLAAVAEAVKRHEEALRRHSPELRQQDLDLYGRVREICAETLGTQRP